MARGTHMHHKGRAMKSPRSSLAHGKHGGKHVSSKIPVSATSGIITKKKHRWKAGTVALREIKKLQKTVKLSTQRRPFQRLVREIMQKFGQFRIQASAIDGLQEALEKHAISTMAYAYDITMIRKCVTLTADDIMLARNHPREMIPITKD